MQYMNGDIWKLIENGGWAVVTTNTVLRSTGYATMGAGIAKDAVERFPNLEKQLGAHIRRFNDRIFISKPVICFPTKRDWRYGSRLEWIVQGCHELVDFARILKELGHNEPIYLPKLGCGLGGLNWERQVRPAIDVILESDQFVLVSQ